MRTLLLLVAACAIGFAGVLLGRLTAGGESLPAAPASGKGAVVPAGAPEPSGAEGQAGSASAGAADANVPADGWALHPAVHAFGPLHEGEARTVALRVERPDDAGALRFGRLYSPCPCVRVSAERMTAEADAPAAVQVRLHSRTLLGAQSFPVYVELLAPERRTLRADVTATVERVPADLRVAPDALHLGAVAGGEAKTVHLTNLMKTPLRITAARVEGAPLSVTPAAPVFLEGGETHTFTLAVPADGLPAGPVRATLHIETDHPLHREMALPIDGTVR